MPTMPLALLGAAAPTPMPHVRLIHPEAVEWASRVAANSSSVSAATLLAASDFCYAIDAAGIRDRFFRLSLMCGNSLSAALVPLYRGQGRAGTQFGGNDTNYNFASGDYAETGTSGGLLGNGSNKLLLTPLAGTDFGAALDTHCSVYWRGTDPIVTQRWCGSFGGPVLMCETSGNSVGGRSGDNTFMSTTISASGTNQQGHHVTSRTSQSDSRHFRNGLSIVQRTDAITVVTPSATRMAVFAAAIDNAGGGNSFVSRRIAAYSFGLGFTTTQAAAYYTAMQAFQSALGRNV